MLAYLEDYGKVLLIPHILRERELLDHLRAMEACILRTFNIDDLVIIPTLDHYKYLGVISHPHSIVILNQFNDILLCILILPQYDFYFSFSVHKLVCNGMSSFIPIGDIRGLILTWRCRWIELLSYSELLVF